MSYVWFHLLTLQETQMFRPRLFHTLSHGLHITPVRIPAWPRSRHFRRIIYLVKQATEILAFASGTPSNISSQMNLKLSQPRVNNSCELTYIDTWTSWIFLECIFQTFSCTLVRIVLLILLLRGLIGIAHVLGTVLLTLLFRGLIAVAHLC